MSQAILTDPVYCVFRGFSRLLCSPRPPSAVPDGRLALNRPNLRLYWQFLISHCALCSPFVLRSIWSSAACRSSILGSLHMFAACRLFGSSEPLPLHKRCCSGFGWEWERIPGAVVC